MSRDGRKEPLNVVVAVRKASETLATVFTLRAFIPRVAQRQEDNPQHSLVRPRRAEFAGI